MSDLHCLGCGQDSLKLWQLLQPHFFPFSILLSARKLHDLTYWACAYLANSPTIDYLCRFLDNWYKFWIWMISRAYRAAGGGKRACNFRCWEKCKTLLKIAPTCSINISLCLLLWSVKSSPSTPACPRMQRKRSKTLSSSTSVRYPLLGFNHSLYLVTSHISPSS